ncbi:Hyaluronidase [Hypsibius exemplaris]|uniref:Hyaluronidase n=1 Tax=Hypsibius exemplaris TaxID=2072580 RepID=A0A9X6NK05_HYPEX|nr:Hyaluronidase [Hypsibius exemplaris]
MVLITDEVLPQLLLSLTTSFQLIWNVPSQPCEKDFGVALHLGQYGFVYNIHQTFIGEKIGLFYNLGKFPRFVKNLAGRRIAINGGIPQLGDLKLHLAKVHEDVTQATDEDFSGLGVIDFESWRAVARQNFDELNIYNEASEDEVRRFHPSWSDAQVKAKAALEFNAGAQQFLLGTLQAVQKLRPKAQWGFYHYPYCFAQTAGQSVCAETAVTGNDQLSWLFNSSQLLLPSLYMSQSGSTLQDRAQHVLAAIRETVRDNRKKRPILPYISLKYQDGGFLSKEDLINSIGLTYDYGGAGVIIWGSSSDVNSVSKCSDMKTYLTETFGPVAEYFNTILSRCSQVFCGPTYRCQPRLRQRRKQPFMSRLDRLSALSYLVAANPALGRRTFRREFRCVPWQ